MGQRLRYFKLESVVVQGNYFFNSRNIKEGTKYRLHGF